MKVERGAPSAKHCPRWATVPSYLLAGGCSTSYSVFNQEEYRGIINDLQDRYAFV